MEPKEYQFTEDWFTRNLAEWNQVIPQLKPRKILEIGSYEGRSACYFIEQFAADHQIELHCIDTWGGGREHAASDMPAVESRFDNNIAKAQAVAGNAATVVKHKKPSNIALTELAAQGHLSAFDLVFVDGSHQAADVLSDAVISFQLLRVGGLMIFDDYLWGLQVESKQDPLEIPKLGIDAFLNVFQRKMQIVRDVPLHQLFALKISE